VGSSHLKDGEMSSSRQTHVVYIIKSEARLADYKGVRWRRNYSLSNEGLEVGNAGDGDKEVISPSSHNGVGLDPLMIVFFEEAQKGFPEFTERKSFFCGRILYEDVILARRFSTIRRGVILCPKKGFTTFAFLSHKAIFDKEGKFVLCFGKNHALTS
jgi:hypothetical protein